MKKRKKTLVTTCLLSGLLGIVITPTIFPPETAIASSNNPLTLSVQKINNNTEAKINVNFGSNVKKVLLPDGTHVTQPTSITVNENRTYDFVAYDSKNRPTQQHITISGLDVDHAPLTTAHGLYIKLHVDTFDTISGIDSYRYRLDNGSWSSWIKYKENNNHEIQIPLPSKSGSFIDERSVIVEARDKAGNIRSTQTKFRVDHSYPEAQDYTSTIYTNKSKIRIPLVVQSYFKQPETLVIKEGSKSKSYSLNQYNPYQTILERRPNKYRFDYQNQIEYEINPVEGSRNLELIVGKSYRDFKGNVVKLDSNNLKRSNLTVMYDVSKPTGVITIQADEKNEVRSHDVIVDLSFTDKYSGVESVRVFEKGTHKEYILTKEQIAKGKHTIPWTLSVGKDGQVFMEITDRAGNKAVYASNKVTISNLQVTGFTLTDVVNPSGGYINPNGAITQFPKNGLSWQFDGNNVRMVAGGNISFKIYYDVGYVDLNRYKVYGKYKITMVDNGKIVYQSDDIEFNTNEKPIGDQFFNKELHKPDDERTHSWYDGGFETTFTLPTVQPNGQPFNDGTKVYISSTLTRYEKADGSILTTTFEDPDSLGNLIGVIRHHNGAVSMSDFVRFREKN